MPGGVGRESAWSACLHGVSGINEIRGFDASSHAIGVAGEVADGDFFDLLPEDKIDKVDRFAALAMAASREALDDSGLVPEAVGEETGVYMGSCYSGRKCIDHQNEKMYRGGARRVHPRLMQNNLTNAASGEVAIYLGLTGANLGYSVGYSSGAYAVAQACNALQLNPLTAILAGGAEAPVPPLVLDEMKGMGEMSRRRENPARISSPFDKGRDGFVASEGSCVLVLESLESAKSRDAHIYAERAGFEATCDAYHMTVPAPDKVQISRAMTLALADARVAPDEVDYISAHGTSTEANDLGETNAIKAVFGEKAYAIPVSSIKSMIGHAIGAAGAIELVATILAMENGRVPPTINQEEPDPGCDLDYVANHSRDHDVEIAMSNSFGFGGNNSSLLLRRP